MKTGSLEKLGKGGGSMPFPWIACQASESNIGEKDQKVCQEGNSACMESPSVIVGFKISNNIFVA